jgi:hypothetical protein
MRAREFLSESILLEKARGLLYRDPGDKFVNPQGQEIEFQRVAYAPSQPGAYATKEELDDAVAQIKQNYPNVVFVNNQDNSMRAVAVVEFTNTKTKNGLYFARFFKQITNDMTGQWKNDGIPGNWQLQKASSLKSSYKMAPLDIFGPGAEFASPQALIKELSNNPNGQPLAADAAVILQGQLPVFKGLAEKETAIRDNFGEVLAPVALLMKLIKTPGAEEAKRVLNNNKDWAGTIRFGKGKIEGLTDSYLDLPTGITLGISSKGKSGATASIKNIYDGIKVIEKQQDQTLITENPEVISILKIVAEASSLEGPFAIAKALKIADVVKLQPIIKELIAKNPPNFQAYPAYESVLVAYANRKKADTTNPRYNVGYRILAVIAEDMATEVNKIKGFGETCIKLVNAAPIIQIYAKTAKKGEDVAITGFDALYPPNFNGVITLDASKVYYATGTNGRYTFAFNPFKST